jgi:hypothetical protein
MIVPVARAVTPEKDTEVPPVEDGVEEVTLLNEAKLPVVPIR